MSAYDQRQYRLMLSRLKAYEAGQASLHNMATDLEAVLYVLEESDPNWAKPFQGLVTDLHIERDVALEYGQRAFDESSIQLINETVAQLKQMVLSKIEPLEADEDV